MGRYYAQAQKENASVADAIRDHYKPQGPTDSVPTDTVAICVALADKIDTVSGMFSIGEKPTGSKDPFALRRAALGVIRVVLEHKIRIKLAPIFYQSAMSVLDSSTPILREEFIANAMKTYKNEMISGKINIQEIIDNSLGDEQPKKYFSAKITLELLEFFNDRLKVQLKDLGLRHDVINAVAAGGDDLVRVVERAKAVQEFITTDDGINLLAGYKRASNILTIEEKKDKVAYDQAVESSNLKEAEEKALCDMLGSVDRKVKTLVESEKFVEAMKLLAELRVPVDRFFEKTMVNCEDKELRANRLRLLSFMRNTINTIADFALIEGEIKEQKKAA
jgi:glycyl-tRNA synthetase beta chain